MIAALLFEVNYLWAAMKAKGTGKIEDRPDLSGKLETGLEYDSNIFQKKTLEESDLIWASSISLNYRPDQIRWSALVVHNQYLDNSELSYSFYEIGVERPFGEKDYGSIFVQVSPTAPLDKDESFGPPISLESYGFTAIYDRDFTRFWNSGLSFSYDRIDYNEIFNAKDTHLVKIGFPQFLRVDRTWRFSINLTLESGFASGGLVPSGIGFRQDDISFRANVFSLQSSYPVTPLSRVRVRYRIRKKTYTTNNIGDEIHFNRKDTNHQLLVGLRHRANPKMTLRTRLRHIWRESTDPFVEFDEVTFSFSAAYRF